MVALFFTVAVLAVTVLVVRPDPKPMIERMPGWSRDLWRTGEAVQQGPPA